MLPALSRPSPTLHRTPDCGHGAGPYPTRPWFNASRPPRPAAAALIPPQFSDPVAIKLTPTQQMILLDRLQCDAIPSVLVDTYDCSEADAEAAVQFVTTEVLAGLIHEPLTWTELQQEALRDSIDGGTWFSRLRDAIDDGEVPKGRVASHIKAINQLRKALLAAGLDCSAAPES